ncbi:MAG TPA: PUA domain-containing protein [Nitrososphaerales archaeon]|nr:PUA domain-containing protein [Nitrososphaerales archaeon]
MFELRTYNLSKTAREEVFAKASAIAGAGAPPFRSKDLKIAESDEEGSNLAVIFDTSEKLYLGRRLGKGVHGSGKEEGFLIFPLLSDEVILPKKPVITVDSGAVKFVCNGANIMRPGIVKFEGEFGVSEIVLVKEQKYGKAIAVGRALASKQELESMKKGPAFENLHYVGDKFWVILKEIEKSF